MSHLLLAAAPEGSQGLMGMIMPIALMLVVMYFMIIRPQKKREKQVQEMRSRLEVGDSITTVGGILGIVVSIRDDSLVIESSADRSKLRITRWAIQTNDSAKTEVKTDSKADAKALAKAEKAEAKSEKAEAKEDAIDLEPK